MIVTAWILFVFFLILFLVHMTEPNKRIVQWVMVFIEIMVIAITAGIIWGGLFQ